MKTQILLFTMCVRLSHSISVSILRQIKSVNLRKDEFPCRTCLTSRLRLARPKEKSDLRENQVTLRHSRRGSSPTPVSRGPRRRANVDVSLMRGPGSDPRCLRTIKGEDLLFEDKRGQVDSTCRCYRPKCPKLRLL